MPSAMAFAKGSILRDVSGTTASVPRSPTPTIDAPSKTPPFAYQLTPTFGTLPLFASNLPLI